MSIPKFSFGQTVGIKGGEFTGIIRKCIIDENGITYWVEHAPYNGYCQWSEKELQEVHIIWEVEAPKAVEPVGFKSMFDNPVKGDDFFILVSKPLPKEVEDDEIPF